MSNDRTSNELPVGSIVMWGGNKNNVPEGWLYCDGRMESRSTYPDLADAIGLNFGNPQNDPDFNPSTQFFLPDFRGYFARGVDDSSGHDPDADKRVDIHGKQVVGARVGSLQADMAGPHAHDYNCFPKGKGNIAAGNYWDCGESTTGGPFTVDTKGARTYATETRPKNVAVCFIIKARN